MTDTERDYAEGLPKVFHELDQLAVKYGWRTIANCALEWGTTRLIEHGDSPAELRAHLLGLVAGECQ